MKHHATINLYIIGVHALTKQGKGNACRKGPEIEHLLKEKKKKHMHIAGADTLPKAKVVSDFQLLHDAGQAGACARCVPAKPSAVTLWLCLHTDPEEAVRRMVVIHHSAVLHTIRAGKVKS